MFKWQFAAVVAAGLALVSSGSPAVAGMQDQAEPVSKKPAMKKGQDKAQQKVTPKQQKVSPKGQAPVQAKGKGQNQGQEQTSVKPSQPSGKGKVKSKRKAGQGHPRSQMGPRPQTQPQ